jgi:hypothetical protein
MPPFRDADNNRDRETVEEHGLINTLRNSTADELDNGRLVSFAPAEPPLGDGESAANRPRRNPGRRQELGGAPQIPPRGGKERA